MPGGFVFAALLLLVVVLALVLGARAYGGAARATFGGAESPRVQKANASDNVVVDTLNLTHWLAECAPADTSRKAKKGRRQKLQVTQCDIVGAIERTAPILKDRFPGEVIYVVKDRDSVPNDERTRIIYAVAARRCGVSVHITERTGDARAAWQPDGSDKPTHQGGGRDDFYMGVLAWKYRCVVLTEDRMRDFQELKHEVDPFRVHTIDHWRLPTASTGEGSGAPGIIERLRPEHYNPGAREFVVVRSPVRVGFADIFGGKIERQL